MTPQLERLREIAAARRRLDDEEAEILDAMARAQPAAPSAPTRRPGRGKLVNIGQAEKITGMSRSWLYTLARRRPDVGWRTESAGWRFDETALRAIFDPPSCAINAMCAENTGEIISGTHSPVYFLDHTQKGTSNDRS